MLFKKFKSKINCFFVVREVTWEYEVSKYCRKDIGGIKLMQCLEKLLNFYNNIKNSLYLTTEEL